MVIVAINVASSPRLKGGNMSKSEFGVGGGGEMELALGGEIVRKAENSEGVMFRSI